MFWEEIHNDVPNLSDEIHVWKINLDELCSQISHLQTFLSEDEKQRAGRYHFQKDAFRFIAARASLRILLARYVNASPKQIDFDYSEYGKPYVSRESSDLMINFNISHSERLALIAFGMQEEIGVDIEMHREDFATFDIAQRFFSAVELESLLNLTKLEFKQAFFNCWTRKEAYIKAKGLGLSLALDSFAVETADSPNPKLQVSEIYPADVYSYSFHSFEPEHRFSAALAADTSHLRAIFLNFSLSSRY